LCCCDKTVTTKEKYTEYPYSITDGSIYCDESENDIAMLTVTNPFSGESYRLTGIEESIYSIIMGAQMVPGYFTNPKAQQLVRKGCDWFRTNNAEAYMKLLD